MMVVDILLWVLLILLALVALLVLMPISFAAVGELDDEEGAWYGLRGTWAFGLLGVQVSDGVIAFRLMGLTVWREPLRETDPDKREKKRLKKEARKARKAEKDKKKAERKKAKQSDDDADSTGKDGGVVRTLNRLRLFILLAGRAVHTLHLSGRVEGIVGLPDAHQTAQLHRSLLALETLLPEGLLGVDVDWVEEVLYLRARLGGWVWPAQVLWLLLTLYLDRETWRALRAA